MRVLDGAKPGVRRQELPCIAVILFHIAYQGANIGGCVHTGEHASDNLPCVLHGVQAETDALGPSQRDARRKALYDAHVQRVDGRAAGTSNSPGINTGSGGLGESSVGDGSNEGSSDGAADDDAGAVIPPLGHAVGHIGFDCTAWDCPGSGPSASTHPAFGDWHRSGSASLSPWGVILTPDMPGMSGALWSLNPFDSGPARGGFDLEMSFRVGGAGEQGADGLALWFTAAGLEDRFQAKGFGVKHAFGHVDQWTGLGIFFDTYDNDASPDPSGARRVGVCR